MLVPLCTWKAVGPLMRRMGPAVVRRPDTRVAWHVDVSKLSLRLEAMTKLAPPARWEFSSVLRG